MAPIYIIYYILLIKFSSSNISVREAGASFIHFHYRYRNVIK